jgi:tRNA A37 methylthiotransferase MiaB
VKVFLATYRCRANQYDTEAVRAMLLAAGHQVVPTAGEAHAAVFNSCAVTVAAEADLRAGVRRSARSGDPAGGSADVAVVGEGVRGEGLTEDNRAVTLSDPGLPRRSRLRATLELTGGELLARVRAG